MSVETLPPLIALVGMSGVGKSEASKVLCRHNYRPVYFGGVVINEVVRRGLAVTPSNERAVREDLRRQEGMGVMAARSVPTIRAALDSNHLVVVDGLYSAEEEDILRAEFPELRTIAIHAPMRMRMERLGARPERPLSVQEMHDRDKFELSALNKAPPIVLADFHLVNDRTPADLERALEALLHRERRPSEPSNK